MIQIGILGCGNIARGRHIPEYAANPDCTLRGYYNPTRSKAEEMAARFGGTVYDSADELLADPMIDAVSVCTANDVHAEYSIRAMKAGKHVLCEKPMATTLPLAEEMVRVSRETGKLLMIGHNQQLLPAHTEAKEMLDAGLIGRVLSFRTTFGHGGPEMFMAVKDMNSWFFRRERAGMGVLADLGIHQIDLIQYLLGDHAVRVSAMLQTLDKRTDSGAPIDVDDNAVCLLEMAGGAVGTVTASWTYYGDADNSTVLYGTKGVMKLYEDPEHPLIVKLADRSTVIGQAPPADHRAPTGIVNCWIESIKAGKVLHADAESSLQAMKTVFAAIESAESGKSVSID